MDHHKILGISREASEREIKTAYRKLALKYHPDLNSDPGARKRFMEINEAYKALVERGEAIDTSREEAAAREVYRRERERMQRQARARWEKKKKEDEYFDRPEWHDPILLVKYAIHILALLIAIAAVVGPVLLVILTDPASAIGTFFFFLAGIVMCLYIYQHRDTWFRQGTFKTGWKDVRRFLAMEKPRITKERCRYRSRTPAGGKSFTIELIRTEDVKIRSFGVLDHEAAYQNRKKRVVMPRSVSAHLFHRVSSAIKVAAILGCLLFLPFDSLLWRFFGGVIAGGVLSGMVLGLARVRSKVSYLFTPALLLKAAAWIAVISLVSEFGPGFNIQTTGYVYLALAGLLFLLDMVFDLVLGFFPFYHRLFRPVVQQVKPLDRLYREGFQNYQELPVYSVLFPLFRWIF